MLLTLQMLNLLESGSIPPIPPIPPNVLVELGGGGGPSLRSKQYVQEILESMYAAGVINEVELAALVHMDGP